jgi:hypothetical protein
MATKSKTGSQKLAGKGTAPSSAKLRALVDVLQKYKFDKTILVKGTPWPDFIKGEFTTKDSAAVLDVVRKAIQINAVSKGIVILPNGQPGVIDRFDVQIKGIQA